MRIGFDTSMCTNENIFSEVELLFHLGWCCEYLLFFLHHNKAQNNSKTPKTMCSMSTPVQRAESFMFKVNNN